MHITSKGRELADHAHLGDNPVVLNTLSRICRAAVTYERNQEDICNGHPANSSPTLPNETIFRLQEAWEKRTDRQDERLERLISNLAETLPDVTGVTFNGDPRGSTVRLLFTGKRYDFASRTWISSDDGFPAVEICVPGA